MNTKEIDKMEHYIGTAINANLFRGAEAVGGKIHFCDKSFLFESHKLNIQKGKTEINYAEIDSIRKRSPLKVVPNGIKITLTNRLE